MAATDPAMVHFLWWWLAWRWPASSRMAADGLATNATATTTGRVRKEVTKLYNRWWMIKGSKGGVPLGLSMQQVYLHVRDTLSQLREYGAAF